jgi:hypothetical protein
MHPLGIPMSNGKIICETCREFPLPGLLEGNLGEPSTRNPHSQQLFVHSLQSLLACNGLIREAMPLIKLKQCQADPCALAALHSQGLIQVLLRLRSPASRLTWPRTCVVSRHATNNQHITKEDKENSPRNLLASSLVGSPPNSVCCKSSRRRGCRWVSSRKMRRTSTDER